jgi:hypothetical protein
LYADGRWSTAFGRFAALAEHGHPDAARIALLMVRYGPQLYHSAWSVTAGQLARWQQAAVDGSAMAALDAFSD